MSNFAQTASAKEGCVLKSIRRQDVQKTFKNVRLEICDATPNSRRRTTANRGRGRAANTRASRRAGRSGYRENDAATGKEHSQDRRVRRPYRLIARAKSRPLSRPRRSVQN